MPVKAPASLKPGLSRANRSLERGVDILRAFRPGSAWLGNGEISERTGLSKSTVSRLTQTLVGAGLLHLEPGTRVYQLAPAVLSLAHAMRMGSSVLTVAAPLIKETAEKHRVNVGLAAPDQDEMIYLESIRYNRRPSLRTVVSGQRVPMELTSLGRAYLAIAHEIQKKELLKHFQKTRKKQWEQLKNEINDAIHSVQSRGYCMASWQPEVVAIASPLQMGADIYAINISVLRAGDPTNIANELAPVLMELKKSIENGLKASLRVE